MTDYTKLAEDLRDTERVCRDRMDGQVMLDAADAIEVLQKDLTTLQKCYEIADTTVDEVLKQLPKRGEIVRCKDCDSWDTEQSSGRKSLGNYVCICQEWSDGEDARWVYTGENEYCSRGEPKEKTEVQE